MHCHRLGPIRLVSQGAATTDVGGLIAGAADVDVPHVARNVLVGQGGVPAIEVTAAFIATGFVGDARVGHVSCLG